jgi:hypothetical protein
MRGMIPISREDNCCNLHTTDWLRRYSRSENEIHTGYLNVHPYNGSCSTLKISYGCEDDWLGPISLGNKPME